MFVVHVQHFFFFFVCVSEGERLSLYVRMCACPRVFVFVCVGVGKISRLMEVDHEIRVFVFVSPVLMTSAAQAPLSISRVRGGRDVSNSDLQVKKTITAGR